PQLALTQQRDAEANSQLEAGLHILQEHPRGGMITLLRDLFKVALVGRLIKEADRQVLDADSLGDRLCRQLQPAGLMNDGIGEEMLRHSCSLRSRDDLMT